ncbi:Predicted component of the ribosome quality control (RQC) complex, YloA/Tae2 family, contains fibronectin-binding (FbpA) and DUF814 domains [Clostridium amylolyticum]|uniref:Rqc2 homolog RqcH n=1 Tax=Clostridium amylolyticum TaxID=1121298 RepID=A0A1M6KJ75_9CLOT|nr:NFACT RNA binding domain-containing protein [Clostridium amylolyticum]SHJ59024.1 Predicted component of the ribosome quality control (RQC) complex, YloA/Tae2 family, contains fibronectin-binding (FbpA) and DUF814 domains [Clostridium amylolyticum]
MALDGIFLSTITSEIRNEIIDCKIDKINQPEKDELLISIRGKKNIKLLISANATYPRIHLTDISKVNPMQPPMFCMVLRKYLTNGRIKNIYQLDSDRILCMDISNTDELGFDSVYTLIVEIMGRHSNITLIRARDHKIMDCIKHITPEINSFRTLLPGMEYKYPPKSEKLNPFNFSYDEVTARAKENNFILDKNFLFNVFTGFSKIISKDLFIRASFKEPVTIPSLLHEVEELLNSLGNNKFHFVIYYDGNKPIDFYCYPLINYEDSINKEFPTASKLLDSFYSEKDKQDRIKGRTQDIEKLISTNLDRCYKKVEILNSILEEAKEKDTYKIFGELLTANIYSIKLGDKNVKLWNYYSEDNEYLDIKLEENLTPSENIQKYFKKYNKLKKSEISALEQIKHAEEEINYLTSVLNSISHINSYDEIHEIREELIEAGYIKFKKTKIKNKPTKPHHYISSNGLDIYVGKNNIQNDYLTLKFANKNDLWFHTKNIPGSHVIIRGKNISESDIMEAAILAATFSKAQNSSNVPVDYTEIRNVKKPSGAKPGMVIYSTNKTIYVNPGEIKIKRAE